MLFGVSCFRNLQKYHNKTHIKLLNYNHLINNSNDEHKSHFGFADNNFKKRYRNHIRDFKHQESHLVTFTEEILNGKLHFFFVQCLLNGQLSQKFMGVCLTKKLWIINVVNDESMLNKKIRTYKRMQTFK